MVGAIYGLIGTIVTLSILVGVVDSPDNGVRVGGELTNIAVQVLGTVVAALVGGLLG